MFIKELQLEVELLINKESDANIKSALVKLAENIRYSDPISGESLFELEENILNRIKNIENSKNKLVAISEIDGLIVERNKRCKILK